MWIIVQNMSCLEPTIRLDRFGLLLHIFRSVFPKEVIKIHPSVSAVGNLISF